jgi:signal transduction histidine kinase
MKKIYRILLFCTLCFGAFNGNAQGVSLVDSLKTMLKNPPNDSVKTRWTNSLFGLYLTIDMDSALYFGNQAKALAEGLQDSVLIASNTLNFGGYYWYQSDFTKAMECYVKAAAIFDKLGSKTDMADAQINIATIYLMLGDNNKAKPFYFKAVDVYLAYDYFTGLSTTFNYLGYVYHEEGKLDSAIYYFEKCVFYAKKAKLITNEAQGISGLGEVYQKLGNFAKARDYKMESLRIDEKLGNKIGIMQSYIQLGGLEKLLGNIQAAESYFEKALATPEVKKDFPSQFKLYQLLTQLYEDQGDINRAYQSYKMMVAANDSLKNSEDLAVINELNEKYESEKKAIEIASLQKDQELSKLTLEKERNQKWVFGGASILFLFISGGLILGYSQLKKSKSELDNQNQLVTKINKALNKSQDELIASNKTKDKFFALIAHDLRGPVTSMQGIGKMLSYYSKKGDENRINQLIEQVDQSATSVNHLLDNLLKWALSQTNGLNFQPAIFEVKTLVEECVSIFDEGFKAKEITLVVSIEKDMLVEGDYNMISTVLRNLVSNAMKFSPVGGEVIIAIEENADMAKITVTDSGRGMTDEMMEKIRGNQPLESTRGTQDEKGTGLGLVLCQEFIKKHNSELSIATSANGTAISFSLQLLQVSESA